MKKKSICLMILTPDNILEIEAPLAKALSAGPRDPLYEAAKVALAERVDSLVKQRPLNIARAISEFTGEGELYYPADLFVKTVERAIDWDVRFGELVRMGVTEKAHPEVLTFVKYCTLLLNLIVLKVRCVVRKLTSRQLFERVQHVAQAA